MSLNEVAKMLFNCNKHSDSESVANRLAWFAGHYITMWAESNIPSLVKVYDALVKCKHTEDNKHIYNDADCCVWYIPHDSKKIIVHTDQTTRYLYVIENRLPNLLGVPVNEIKEVNLEPALEVYRFYKEITEETLAAFGNYTYDFEGAARGVSTLEEYTDSPENHYPYRPTLKWLLDNKVLTENDELSWKNRPFLSTNPARNVADSSVYSLIHVKLALFMIELMADEFKGKN